MSDDDKKESLNLDEIAELIKLPTMTAPDAIRKQPLKAKIPHKLVFGAVGKAGEHKVIEVRPERYFRGESIDAKDTLDGAGTVITMLLVGKKMQALNQPGPALETRELMRRIRKGHVAFKMDTCDRALSICLGVIFKEGCEFRAEISGVTAE